jgi:hypothetical protein
MPILLLSSCAWWRSVTQCAMRSVMVVKREPWFDDCLRFAQVPEPFPVQTFITQFAIEAFRKPVMPGLSRPNESGSHILVS